MKYLVFALLIVSVSACQWGIPNNTPPAITHDTLAYTIQQFRKKAPAYSNNGVKDTNSVTIMAAQYPWFKNQSALNDTITRRLSSMFATAKTDTSLQQLSQQFLTGYTAFMKTSKLPSLKIGYRMYASATIIRQDSSLLVLFLYEHAFRGSENSNTVSSYLNWNTKTGKKITLDDILVKGYRDKLTAIADTIFRKQEKLSYTASLANGYFFKDNKFALNNNFLITPSGINFLYNETEIKPYSAGQTEVAIPYSKIKSLLLPHTVITQYIK